MEHLDLIREALVGESNRRKALATKLVKARKRQTRDAVEDSVIVDLLSSADDLEELSDGGFMDYISLYGQDSLPSIAEVVPAPEKKKRGRPAKGPVKGPSTKVKASKANVSRSESNGGGEPTAEDRRVGYRVVE